ncbi:hypothetical protein C2S53_008364 [Perilla frutescens var. hirtella]|uniref:BZIP domain-containing protein n=1 Tax=Perilla frutescens var. hirtella TaxID=608512 RepID=A0AAD4JDK8_PERFH|nr:hypothetical protein C2S53_008364 [Perilla frutescens var. hirtella]
MSSKNINISSSSEDDETRYAMITDEKKRKRMISNRESARRSRMKREQHIKDLNDQTTYFRSRKGELVQRINEIGRRYVAVESENRMLRMHGEELKKRLKLMEEMLVSYRSSSSNNAEEVNDDCFVMDILQDPDLKPWLLQPTFQTQTVDGIYQF